MPYSEIIMVRPDRTGDKQITNILYCRLKLWFFRKYETAAGGQNNTLIVDVKKKKFHNVRTDVIWII